MSSILLSSVFLLSLTSFFPLLKSQHWIVRDFDFPRFQFFVINSFFLIYLIFQAEKTVLFSVVFATLVLAWIFDFYRIAPYFPGFRSTVKRNLEPKSVLKIISANVRTKNQKYGEIKKLISKHDPDLILLIEIDQKWADALSGLIDDFPYSIVKPMDNTYGFILLSRKTISNQNVLYRVDESVPSILVTIEDETLKKIRLYGLHPRPPRPSEAHSTERDAELMQVADEVAEEKFPTIVLGDLNDVAWSRTTRLFLRVSGLLDPRHGRGFYNTFHSLFPALGFPLDHIFISSHFNLVDLTILPSIGSDHRPLLIELEPIKSSSPENKEKKSSFSDEKEKEQKINEGEEWEGPISTVDPDE